MQVVEGGDDLDRVKQRRRRVEPAGTENGSSASFAPPKCTRTHVARGQCDQIWQNFDGLFVFGKLLSLLWQICYIIVLIFIVANDQIL